MSAPANDRFHRVDPVFDAVLDPAEDQPAWIDEACVGDAEPRAEVIQLLRKPNVSAVSSIPTCLR